MPNEFPPHSPFIWSQARPRREGKTRPILPSGVSWVHPHVSKVWREESRLVGSVRVKLKSNQVKDDLNGTSLLNTMLTVFFKIFFSDLNFHWKHCVCNQVRFFSNDNLEACRDDRDVLVHHGERPVARVEH